MGDPLASLAEWITDVIHALGYVGVALLIALENVFPPIPSELILPLAGFLAGRGRFSLPIVIVAATLGSVAGALILYEIGRRFGEHRLRGLVRRYGRFLLLRESDLDQAQRWFDRHGAKAVLIGRVIPVVRSLISIPAGIQCMPLGPFLLYTAIGSVIWNTLLIGLGWWLGDRWTEVEEYTAYLEYAVLAVLAILVGRFVWKRLQTAR